LVTEDSYQAEDYEAALKKAFLGTDEDLLASEVFPSSKKEL
jgi:protein phosphatase 2C family protein 2/3